VDRAICGFVALRSAFNTAQLRFTQIFYRFFCSSSILKRVHVVHMPPENRVFQTQTSPWTFGVESRRCAWKVCILAKCSRSTLFRNVVISLRRERVEDRSLGSKCDQTRLM